MGFEQLGSTAFDDPADRGAGIGVAQGAGDRNAVDHVAKGGESNDEDAGGVAQECGGHGRKLTVWRTGNKTNWEDAPSPLAGTPLR
jgi:hypothetical protein